MKRKFDKSTKPMEIPPVSKQQFINTYAEALKIIWPDALYTDYDAARVIEDVISGRQCPPQHLKQLAKQHGAKLGRVGNFLRGLR